MARLPFFQLAESTKIKLKRLSNRKIRKERTKAYDRARSYINEKFRIIDEETPEDMQTRLIEYVSDEFPQIPTRSLFAFNSEVTKLVLDIKREEIIEKRKEREYEITKKGKTFKVRRWTDREKEIALRPLPIKDLAKQLDRSPRSIYNLRYRQKKKKKKKK